MDFKRYLKLLNSIDYPNQTEDLSSISHYISYGPHQFQNDLLVNLGVIGTTDFVEKTFTKLGMMSKPGFKVMFNYNNGDYVYLIINSISVIETHEEDELPFNVWINYSWGDSRIVWGDDDTPLTIEDAYDEIGLGEIGEWDELMDSIQDDVTDEVYKRTGFIIHFDAQE